MPKGIFQRKSHTKETKSKMSLSAKERELNPKLKEKRRTGELPIEMSVRYKNSLNNITISTEVGRVLRPLIIVLELDLLNSLELDLTIYQTIEIHFLYMVIL